MSAPSVLVALETSGPLGSVAVAVEGAVVARRFLDEPRTHAARIVPALDQALAEAGVPASRAGGVVVGAGPGSFTGVRVAAATGKGLTHALGIPLYAVSSLEAGALTPWVLPRGEGPWEPAGPDDEDAADAGVTVLFDARGRRLFAASYAGSAGALRVLRAPHFATVDDLLDEARDTAAELPLAGSGVLRHRAELAKAGLRVLPPPHGVPSADALLRRVLDGGIAPLEDPASWEPEYLRATGAERQASGEADPTVG